jgi:hypothetical protein
MRTSRYELQYRPLQGGVRKLDTSGIAWSEVGGHPLSKGDLFCLHYMMDLENHVSLYLSH